MNVIPRRAICYRAYSYTFRTGFLNLGKKYRRTYKLDKNYSTRLNLDVPLQEIDLGVFNIPFTDKKV